MAFGQYHGDLDSHGIIMEVTHGGGRILLSTIRLCGMDIIPSMALDMYKSLHLTILYLLKTPYSL